MRFHSGLVLACAMLATTAGLSTASYARAEEYGIAVTSTSASSGGQDTNTMPAASSQPGSQPRTAVVLRFACQNHQPPTLNNLKGITRCVSTPKCSWT